MKIGSKKIVVLGVVLAVLLSGKAVAQTNLTIPDLNLEAAVRSTLAKPSGPLTRQDLEALTCLHAHNASIVSLSGLEWATNLKTLHLGANSIHDLSPLRTLGQLSTAYLYNNRVEDISPLAGLSNLNYLVLSYNPITNYDTMLTGFTNLAKLFLGGNTLSNATLFRNLKRLTFLGLEHNSIGDLNPFLQLTNLSGLDLSYNPLTNRATLSLFTNLTELYLSGVAISDLSVLQTLSGLTSLMLYHNLIEDISPLTALPGLTELGLSWNRLTNYHSVLPECRNLERLDLAGNAIDGLGFIEGLSQLKSLDIRNNGVVALYRLAGLNNLQSVNADNNHLTDIETLQDLPQLARVALVGNLLDLSENSSDITVIQNLQSRQVDVAYDPQNEPPSISLPARWTIPVNSPSSISFSVGDDITPLDQLEVTGTSSNPYLISDQDILITGTNLLRTLTLTPNPDQTGVTTIRLIVTDDAGLSVGSEIEVSVIVPQIVHFPDEYLDAAVRAQLGKPQGELTSVDLQALKNLFVANTNTADLTGLERATNLTALHLFGNSISNLSLLPALPGLTFLSLNDNTVANLSILAELTSLTGLRLNGDGITDLTFLQSMPQLTSLSLETNRIVDLSALANLTSLNSLSLQQNLATNIAPIQNLPQLSSANLKLNLLDTNSGTPAMTVIGSLQARGVTVDYLPQRQPPIISSQMDWIIVANATSWFAFGVADDGASRGLLVAGAKSSNLVLLPNSSLSVTQDVFGYWLLRATPNPNQSGTTTITLSVTNDAGLQSSTNILVTVANPLPLGNALFDSTNLVWNTGGNAAWFGQTNRSQAGLSAARSGSLNDGQQSWLETTLLGPGTLDFWWKISSEPGGDFLQFYIDGVMQPERISGEVDWQQEVVNIAAGNHVVRWSYSKDSAAGGGLDAGWLDHVSFTPSLWLELAGKPTNGQCQFVIHGLQGRLYELLSSDNLVSWFTLTTVATTNATMPFLAPPTNPSRCFFRLREVPANSIWLENPRRLTNGVIQLVLHGPAGLRFDLQRSTNLVNWTTLATVTNSFGTVTNLDSSAASFSARFYRIVVVP